MAGFIVAGFLIIQFSQELPDAASIKGVELKVPLRVYSADQLLISEFGNERRKPIAYQDTPQNLIDAILASEDDSFFVHRGIDFRGLLRAALSNYRTGRTGQGASTITMQVARNFFLTRDKTYARKLKEVLLAIRLEQLLSKEEILSLYLNKIFLGHRAYGFGAAADVYYGKSLETLSLAEIAMLAGLPKAPSSFNPLRNPERAITRRNYVLGRLKTLEKISNSEYREAIAAPITAAKHKVKASLTAPHIAEMVRARLTEELGEDAYWQGLNVYTTIFSKQQQAADQALRAGLHAYDRRHGYRGPVGKFKLDKLQESASDSSINSIEQHYEDLLSGFPNSHEQAPALVIDVVKDNATVWTRDQGQIKLPLSSARWAKRHKTANRVGDPPKAMTELMAIGDVVYIQPDVAKQTAEPSEQDTPPKWRLSQIPNVSGALISMDPNSGRILSLVGGYDFFLNKYNRAIQSIRQPGSNIKPFIYSASLEKGFTPASLISGAPIVITDAAHGTVWRPENYGGKFYGPTRMRQALSKSMNLVSIRLLRAIGIPYTRDYLQRFGIDMNRFSSSLTMALGAGGITPVEMLSAYSVLANGGYKVTPYFIEKITDRNGKLVYQAPKPIYCDACIADYLPKPPTDELTEAPTLEQETTDTAAQQTPEQIPETNEPPYPETYEAPRVMTHANNFLTVNMLKDVVRRGTARKALALNRQDLAGKTGTTNEYVDAWFTGFNSRVATTVWVGFDDPKSMGRGEAGSLTALPIWVDYMKTGLDGVAEDTQAVPDYIEQSFIDATTGLRVDEDHPSAVAEFFAIEELSPEYALMQSLYPTAVAPDQSLLSTDELAPGEQLDTLEEDEPYIEQVEQENRIIETTEDTEGLF